MKRFLLILSLATTCMAYRDPDAVETTVFSTRCVDGDTIAVRADYSAWQTIYGVYRITRDAHAYYIYLKDNEFPAIFALSSKPQFAPNGAIFRNSIIKFWSTQK